MINTVLLGDVCEKLKEIPDESVDCCVTSPPYWGLRDYKLPDVIWGENHCEHEWGDKSIRKQRGTAFGENSQTKQTYAKTQGIEIPIGSFCQRCSAWRGSLGLEPNPELYVQHLVEIFREIRHVLKKEATLWLNLGDSYCGSNSDGSAVINPYSLSYKGGQRLGMVQKGSIRSKIEGLKPKDLVGIPWRVAFTLQADGWWLRSDIIWSKPNPMPESVTDRPTKSHEYIFLLSKSASYYFDQETVKEPANPLTQRNKSVKASEAVGNTSLGDRRINYEKTRHIVYTRNLRSVWHIPTQPFRGAHFATFPEKLIEPCIKAGCPKDGIVLDPFLGSGTTAVVAKKLGRNWIGIELNPDYVKMAERRIANTMGLLI